jgi:hypothetical protein
MEPYLASWIITRFFVYKDLIKDFMIAVNVTKLLYLSIWYMGLGLTISYSATNVERTWYSTYDESVVP